MKSPTLLLIVFCLLFSFGCTSSEGDATTTSGAETGDEVIGNPEPTDSDETGTETDTGDTGTDDTGDTDDTDETDVDDTETGDPGADDSDDTGIDIHGNAAVLCNGSPDEIRAGVVGRAIMCQIDPNAIDIHDGIVSFFSLDSGDGSESSDSAPETVYHFDPSAWDLAGLSASLLAEDPSNTELVVDYEKLTDFIFTQGLQETLDDIEGAEEVIREQSDEFASDILVTTHDCVSSYLMHSEVMLDCVGESPPALPCGEATGAVVDDEDACVDHNASVSDFVKNYLTKLGVVGDGNERDVFESILENPDFSESVLSTKITVADLYFYQYYYAKRDWTSSEGGGESHLSFLNPNNWAQYPLVPAQTESDCAGDDIPRCCRYEAFINQYDSPPLELLELVNSCTNELPEMGPYENSELYKVLLQHDGSVGGDGAFTIDEFFRPFILHYEKTTAPEQRGVCYWSALRGFAERTISVDAGNENMEMNAQDMDSYILSYNTTVAEFDGVDPEPTPAGVCEEQAD